MESKGNLCAVVFCILVSYAIADLLWCPYCAKPQRGRSPGYGPERFSGHQVWGHELCCRVNEEQLCYPLDTWFAICRETVLLDASEEYKNFLNETGLLQNEGSAESDEEEDEDYTAEYNASLAKWQKFDWNWTCAAYPRTYPRCITRSDQTYLCYYIWLYLTGLIFLAILCVGFLVLLWYCLTRR